MPGTRGNHLTAADIMQKDVVVVGPSDSLHEALSLMTEHHVSGLPVLNAKDRCVGVISANDILQFEQEQSEFATVTGDHVAPYFDPLRDRWETIRVVGNIDELPDVTVGEVMSRDLISVRPTTPIKRVARKLIDKEIHRILVVDAKQYLHGIISTVEFVRLFVDGKK